MNSTIEERNRILIDMDVEKAKAFIVAHGGSAPKSVKNWERVLHLARLECVTIDQDLRTDSHIYLAQHGAQSIETLPQNSPYLRAALDLIFPVDTFNAFMAVQHG